MTNLSLDQKVTLKVEYEGYSYYGMGGGINRFTTKGTLRECLAQVAESDSFYISGKEIREGHLEDEEEELTLTDILNKLDDSDGAAYIIYLKVRVGNGKYETLIENYYDEEEEDYDD